MYKNLLDSLPQLNVGIVGKRLGVEHFLRVLQTNESDVNEI